MNKTNFGSKCICFLVWLAFLGPQFFASSQSDEVDKLFSQWNRPDSRVSPLSPSQLDEYAGEYHNEELPVTYKLVVEKGNLRFVHKNAPGENLEAMALDKFMVGRFNLKFMRNEHQEVVGFLLGAGRAANVEFIKNKSMRNKP